MLQLNDSNMNKLVFFVIILCTNISLAIDSSFYETQDINDVDVYISEGTLVIFDVDSLIKSQNAYGSQEWLDQLKQKEIEKGANKFEASKRANIEWAKLQTEVTYELVDERIPNYIKKLQENKVPVIGYTSRRHTISNVTIKHLASNDFVFKDNVFNDMQFKFTNKYPVSFYKGVLFCYDMNDKGEVIKQFLEQAEGINRIIIIDDSKEDLDLINTTLTEMNKELILVKYSTHNSYNFDAQNLEISN